LSHEPFKGLRRLRKLWGGEGAPKSPTGEGDDLDVGARLELEFQDTVSESDQTASDSDQTASDSDQTASDSDQTASDSDQVQSDSDQRASERDQAAADLDLARHAVVAEDSDAVQDETLEQYLRTRAERLSTTRERDVSTLARLRVSGDRDRQATARDATAAQRDDAARSRDRLAEALDIEARRAAETLGPQREASISQALSAADAVRVNAASDRKKAAEDRERAARDRDRAAHEREQASEELRAAHIDELTGAYLRGMGTLLLQHELDRALRLESPLVIAFVDVDHLKGVNDTRGYAAGDDLLRSIVNALASSLRPYDPLVRMGGDEFVCALSDTEPDEARKRFDQINGSLEHGSFTVGVTAARSGDTVPILIERSNAEMRRNRDSGAR
jgi:diguanylate cyclase (GGDEF)-like protein